MRHVLLSSGLTPAYFGRTVMGVLVLVAILLVEIFAKLVGNLSPDSRHISYVLIFIALGIAVKRGGLESYVFWITLIAAYPLLAPMISQDMFGLRQFSALIPFWQRPEDFSHPLLLGALACVYLALTLSATSIRIPRIISTTQPLRTDLLVWAALIAGGMVFFAVLGDPNLSFIGTKAYSDILEERVREARFAGGAWAVFGVLAILFYILSTVLSRIQRTLFTWILVLGFAASLLWMLIHARRVEPAGLLLFLLCTLGYKVSLRTKILALIGIVTLFALIGYVRNLYEIGYLFSQNYIPLPGGPENVMAGYVSMFKLLDAGLINHLIGASYLGHIIRLPPGFLSLPRPPEAYDYLADLVKLQGGEYLLIEPYLNFGIVGILGYLPTLVLVANWAVSAVQRFSLGKGSPLGFMVGGIFLALIFRTLWYGPGSAIKAEIIAFVVAGAVVLIAKSYSERKALAIVECSLSPPPPRA